MQVICQCGHHLVVHDIRLITTTLSILVRPCATCRESAHQQGYEDRLGDEKRERQQAYPEAEYCDRCLVEVGYCLCEDGPGHWPTREGGTP
jgi:hypothetical protein